MNHLKDPREGPLLPGGLGRSSLAVGAPPPTVLRGDCYKIWLDDGRELVDLNNNFTALVHGHAHPAVTSAAIRAIRSGASFGLANPSELRHAEALLSRLPTMDQVRYTNSGTEAVMTAIRVARAHTGKDACILIDRAYHGTSDSVLPAGGPRSRRGIPSSVLSETILVPLNDIGALETAIDHYGERLAAIVLDLLPNRAGLLPVSKEFVGVAQRARQKHGSLLIVDEIISFRLRVDGLSGHYELMPDLITLGKLIGGGLPVGAVLGTYAVMAELDPTSIDGLEHGGTFCANPVTMEAGLASLELLDGAAISRMNHLGDEARRELAGRVDRYGWHVRGTGSIFRLVPSEDYESAELQRRLWWTTLERGVLIMPTGLMALSTVMTSEIIDKCLDALVASVASIG